MTVPTVLLIHSNHVFPSLSRNTSVFQNRTLCGILCHNISDYLETATFLYPDVFKESTDVFQYQMGHLDMLRIEDN